VYVQSAVSLSPKTEKA